MSDFPLRDYSESLRELNLCRTR